MFPDCRCGYRLRGYPIPPATACNHRVLRNRGPDALRGNLINRRATWPRKPSRSRPASLSRVLGADAAAHRVWLDAHPERTAEWLMDRIRDGFDVHHADLNHDNNSPDNLILIEHSDHMLLHFGKRYFVKGRGVSIGTRRTRKEKPLYPKPIGPEWRWRFRGVPETHTLDFYRKRWPHKLAA